MGVEIELFDIGSINSLYLTLHSFLNSLKYLYTVKSKENCFLFI